MVISSVSLPRNHCGNCRTILCFILGNIMAQLVPRNDIPNSSLLQLLAFHYFVEVSYVQGNTPTSGPKSMNPPPPLALNL